MRKPSAIAAVALALIGYFVTILDTSIVITALPLIHDELGFTSAGLSWVQSTYLITFGGLLLLGARLGDLIGRRNVLIAGLAVFGVASLLIGFAPVAPLLLAARALQGVGAAMLTPSTLALLTETYPPGAERRRAVGLYAAVAGIGASVGLVAGGLFAALLSWRVGFLINVPITAALIVLAARALPRGTRTRVRFDVGGAALSILAASTLAYAFLQSAESGWRSAVVLVSAAVGVIAMIGLLIVETRVSAPILPLRLLANRERGGAYLIRALFIGGMQAFFFFVSQYLQLAQGFTPLQAGLGFLPMTIVNFAVALVVTRVVTRIGNRTTLIVGLVLTAAGLFWLSRATPDGNYLLAVAAPMVLVGTGQGLAFAPMTSVAIAGAQPQEAGAASGALNVAHQLGGALGLSAITAFAAGTVGSGAAAVSARFDAALLAASVLLVLAVVTAVILVPRSRAALTDSIPQTA